MDNRIIIKMKSGGLGRLINIIQTMFVSLMRIWTIPIVLALSLASGFTTYYGMSHFITPWIALIITVAIQSIIVICSFEIAGIHWRANRLRYFSVLASLLIALGASVSFSYFKFYEISEQDTIHIQRLNEVRNKVEDYLSNIIAIKGELLAKERLEVEQLNQQVTQAYFGTHPEIPPSLRNQIGEGRIWRHYNELYQNKKSELAGLEEQLALLDAQIGALQANLNQLDQDSEAIREIYQQISSGLQTVQLQFNRQVAKFNTHLPAAPVLMPYSQYIQGIKPSFAMWTGFSTFALVCAGMVDFFTVLLSYRLEFTAPGPLTEQEEELVFECLRQFTQFRINENDALEMIIEKTEIEKAKRYIDWPRMFAVGLLLSRGFLRKVDDRTVEFAPTLYPLIAEKLGDKLQKIKEQSGRAEPVTMNTEPATHEQH
ncbi:hypothetical protein [Methylotuvimicrobium buryatense]|uniref:DUF4407 domain-containing protein n=1 Tax=Methylotuvimicrobium buryatense TaxID=95641 RepID=A0A4P9UU14_METBY|nr:hypothetical protein [Methylotuvimicrobium buryatense]QCW84130.1 hypothetical protein EQU24_19225 [Methylotuvimicrobium buryatense]